MVPLHYMRVRVELLSPMCLFSPVLVAVVALEVVVACAEYTSNATPIPTPPLYQTAVHTAPRPSL